MEQDKVRTRKKIAITRKANKHLARLVFRGVLHWRLGRSPRGTSSRRGICFIPLPDILQPLPEKLAPERVRGYMANKSTENLEPIQ